MLSATGSASCVQTGIVAATHARRVSSSGVSGSAEKSIDLVEPQRGDVQGLLEAGALLGGELPLAGCRDAPRPGAARGPS